MKIGDRIFVRGYIDEIRKDTVIVRNDGGYFGTVLSEVTGDLPSVQPEIIHCKECMNHGKEICYFWSHFYGTINTPDDGFCYKAERRTDD